MKVKLTDVYIQKLKLSEGMRLEIFDQQVPGFGLRAGARNKVFFYIRRVGGRKVRMSLGSYPAVTLAKARSQALAILDKIKAGEDPTPDLKRRQSKVAEGEDKNFEAVASRFLAQYCRGKKKPLRERTVNEYERHLTGPLVTSWKRKPIDKITDRDIISVIDQLEAAGHFAAARLFKAYLRKFFGWCVERRLISHNPAQNVPLSSRPSDFVRDRVLTPAEIQHILAAAHKLDAPYCAFVHVLALCGQRRHETSVMRWSDLDLDGEKPIWQISGKITKNHRDHDVPLSDEIVAILKQVPRIIVSQPSEDGRESPVASKYVFSGDGKAPVSGFSKIKAKLDELIERERAANRVNDQVIPHWTWHDLRRSAATGMADLGVAPHIIEAVLNHVSDSKAGVAGIYNRGRYDEERRSALKKWAGHVLQTDENNTVRIGEISKEIH